MANRISTGSIVRIRGGPKHFIGKCGLVIAYENPYANISNYMPDEDILSYKILIDEELAFFAGNELENLSAKI